jgi:hypothetical protein
MRRKIWEWIVEADAWIGWAALDAAIAVLGAVIATESLRSLIESM